MHNILILDCDSVINTIENGLMTSDNIKVEIDGMFEDVYYKPELVRNVVSLCNRYNMKVVLSSTWRKDYPIKYFRVMCQYMGLHVQVIDYTTIDNVEYDQETNDLRSRQITMWLDANNDKCKDYIVLDDMLGAGVHHQERFVHVNPNIGFDTACLNETIKRFDPIFLKGL